MEPEPEPAAAAETGPGRLDDGAPESFTFHHLSDVAGVAATDEGVKELFAKWGFGGAQGMLQRHTFRYDQYYKAYMSDQLIKDFLNSEAVQGVFQVPVKGKEPAPLGTVSSFRCREVPCTVTSLSLFDRLGECGAVRGEGLLELPRPLAAGGGERDADAARGDERVPGGAGGHWRRIAR